MGDPSTSQGQGSKPPAPARSKGEPVISVKGLTKQYGPNMVLDQVDMMVAAGEIVAFLGPNGAGKTTTVEILEGYRTRSGGSVSVLGQDPQTATGSWRERIGIVLQESEPYPELTAHETLVMQSHYYNNPRSPDQVLDLVGLTQSAGQRCGKLSGGQRRRLDLGLALIGQPDLIFLDEPTTGFDPSARREAWEMIESLRQLGNTVLLTTHYMDEAEYLADRILVITGGQIVANGTAQELADQVAAQPTISWSATRAPDWDTLNGPADWSESGGQFQLSTSDVTSTLHHLTSWALTEDVQLVDLEVRNPTLEDVYLSLVSSDQMPSTSAVITQ